MIARSVAIAVGLSCSTMALGSQMAQDWSASGWLDEDGVAEISWTTPTGHEVRNVRISVYEANGVPRGSFDVARGAILWRSSPRRSLIGDGAVFDIRHPSQWNDPRVLTPGERYSFALEIESVESDSQAAQVHQLKLSLQPPHYVEPLARTEVLGSLPLVVLLAFVICVVFLAVPIALAFESVVRCVPLLHSVMRRDIDVLDAVLQITEQPGARSYAHLLLFVALIRAHSMMQLLSLSGLTVGTDDLQRAESIARLAGNVRLRDWEIGRMDLKDAVVAMKAELASRS